MVLLAGTILASGGVTCCVSLYWYVSHSKDQERKGEPRFLTTTLQHDHENVQVCWSLGTEANLRKNCLKLKLFENFQEIKPEIK